MTAPVDIAAAVELARFTVEAGRLGLKDHPPMMEVARALIALADERRDIEQRTAEAIAAWVTSADLTTSDVRCHIAAGIRAGAWKEQP